MRRSRASYALPRSSPCWSISSSTCCTSPWIRASRSAGSRASRMGRRIAATLRRLPKWQMVVLGIFLGTVFLTVFGPYLGPYSSTTASPGDRLMPPSAAHWFGTDENGIDIFSRLLAAPRIDVMIAVTATAISVLLGAPIGVMVALLESRRAARGRTTAEVVMRFLEVIQAFPVFVFAMVLVAVFGGSTINIIAAVAFVNTPVFVRLVR